MSDYVSIKCPTCNNSIGFNRDLADIAKELESIVLTCEYCNVVITDLIKAQSTPCKQRGCVDCGL
jgi:hypothetical protein